MGGVQRKRFHDWQCPEGQDAVGGKKSVFLEMSYLVNTVMRQFKGPEIKRQIYPCDGGMRTVTVSLEVRKIPFQRKSGTPDLEVAFVGSKNISVEKTEHDAVMKLASYLMEKYRVQIADWNYEKLCLTENKLLQIDNSVKVIVGNINDMVGKWKASVWMLSNLQSVFSVSEAVLNNAVSGKLTTIKCMVEADLEHISDWMAETQTEYVQCCKSINSTHMAEDVTTIKIPETEMFSDILLSLGFKEAKFTHTLVDNEMFKGSCNFHMPGTGTSNVVGKTIICGDLKMTASEAECSAAAKSIRYLERFIDLEVVDLSYPTLIEKDQLAHHLLSIQEKFQTIEQHILEKWRSMVSELKVMVNSEYADCKEMGFDVDEHDRVNCADIIQDSLGDINMLFNLSTMGLEQPET